jgi:hypothetical protein
MENRSFDDLGLLLGVIETRVILHILIHGLWFPVLQCDIFIYSVNILIHSPYCGWRMCFACDHWWLFLLLWLLFLGHMHFDLLCCLSGLCLSCGVSKLNWWNLVFSTPGGVGMFDWIWRFVWYVLDSGGIWSFALRNLLFWLLPSWVWNLMFVIHMTWFEEELVLWRVLV